MCVCAHLKMYEILKFMPTAAYTYTACMLLVDCALLQSGLRIRPRRNTPIFAECLMKAHIC